MTILRESCGRCHKFIYKHDFSVVCHLDGSVYHGRCFKLSNDVILEVQQYADWTCPDCLSDAIPFFNDTSSSYTKPLETCSCCSKFISKSRHSIIGCSVCESVVHATCATEYICNLCSSDHDKPLTSPHFNLFSPGEGGDYDLFDHDFEIDDHLDSMTTASAILEQCNYVDLSKFDQEFSMVNTNSFASFYFLNIDGFKTNFDEFILNHESLTQSFDFICFAETNIDSSDLNRFQLSSDYYCLDVPKLPHKQKGSGLTLYYRKTLQVSLVEDLCRYGTDTKYQILGGKLKIETGYLHFLIVYRFHSCPVQEFCTELDSLLNTIDGPCVVLGDFNINCFSFDPNLIDTNDDTELYVNSLIMKGYSPLISKGTRFDNHINNSVTCIDQIWYNMISSNVRSGIFSSSVSDHLPIFSFIPVTVSSILSSSSDVSSTYSKKYAATPVTFETFANHIPSLLAATTEYSVNHSVADNFSFFHKTLHTIHDKCLVDSNRKPGARNLEDHPWISVALAKSSKVKNILYKRWKRAKGDPFEEEKRYSEYHIYRAKLRDLLKISKTNYFKGLFDKCNGDMRKTWGVINKIRCKMKGSASPAYIEFNQQLISDRRAISSLFNSYFTDVANKLNDSKYDMAAPPADDFRKFLGARCTNSILLYDIEPDEIVKIISSFNNNKSSDLCVRAIKHVRHEIAPVLSTLFNDCMLAGIFPAELKIAKVIPLFKSGKRHVLSNYRPISILPLFSKIFEKLIHTRFISFFDKHNIISENQFGFRKNHSTVHALNTAVSSISQSMNNRYSSIGMFIDFSKAFDTIKHDILLAKLEHYGIRGPALDLLSDYLTSRFQYVTIDGVCSDLLPITIGVPQGSVLGPLLFIIYINDIENCIISDVNKSMFVLFADDTNVFISAPTLAEAQNIAESTLQSLSVYLYSNYLHINIKKTKYVSVQFLGKKSSIL